MDKEQKASRLDRIMKKLRDTLHPKTTTQDTASANQQIAVLAHSNPNLSRSTTPQLQKEPLESSALYSSVTPNEATLEASASTGFPPNGSLWARAYHEAKEDKEFLELLEKYQRFLREHYGISDEECVDMFKILDDSGSRLRDTSIQKRAEESFDILTSSRLTLTVAGKTIVIREELEKIVRFLSNFKGVISAATSSEPHAALAWGSVTAALPLLENAIQQDQNAAEGFDRISFLLVRYALLEEKFFNSRSKSPATSEEDLYLLQVIAKKIVTLYATIFKYQLRIILHCVHSKLRRILGNMFIVVDWKQMTSDINENNRQIDEVVNDMHRTDNSIVEKLKDVDRAIRENTTKIVTLQQAALDLAVLDKIPYVANAVFESPDVRKHGECLPGTQRDALGNIQSWIQDPDGQSVFWLSGMAGTGKSSIARTVAQCLNKGNALGSDMPPMDDNIFLGGTFFLSQEDPERNTVRHLIPTISRTLAQRVPALGRYISDCIYQDTTVGNKDLLEQMTNLISKPLLAFNKALPVRIRLIVIVDALDECEEVRGAESFLTLLPRLGRFHNVDVRVLVVSRPENHITCIFEDHNIYEVPPRKYRLEKIPRRRGSESPDDISKYINNELRQFKTDWVKASEMNQLIDRAEGLFIYAATTCRFLAIANDPDIQQSRLQQLIAGKSIPGAPEQQLDDIYRRVLAFPARNHSEQERKALNFKFTTILGAIALMFEPPSIAMLQHLIQPVNGLSTTLENFHSILDVPKDTSSSLKFFHLSFRDFLLTPPRSGSDYCIDEPEIHRRILENCLSIMDRDLRKDLCDLRLPGILASEVSKEFVSGHISPHLRYSCLYWMRHLAKLSENDLEPHYLDDGDRVSKFFLNKFPFWLEALSLLGEYGRSISIIKELQDLLPSGRSPVLSAFIRDAYRFVLKNVKIISQAPLQTYCSALIFSPHKSIVRQNFIDLVPSWIKDFPHLKQQWDQEVMAFAGPPSDVNSFKISNDGNILITSHLDGLTKLWDLTTGLEMLKFEDSSRVCAVAISPDQRIVASGLSDGSIALRDLAGGTKNVLRGPASVVCSIAFLNTDDVLASMFSDGSIWLWDRTKQSVLQKKQLQDLTTNNGAPDYWRHPVLFSPDGKLVIVGCGDATPGAILLWNIAENTEDKVTQHEGTVQAIQISPSGENLASSDETGSVKVWSLKTRAILSQIDFDTYAFDIAWCPQQPSILALGLCSSPITLCDISTATARSIGNVEINGARTAPTGGLAYSQTLGYLISGSDGYIRLWDVDMDAEPIKERHEVQSIDFLGEGGHSALIVMDNTAQLFILDTRRARIVQDNVRKVELSADQSRVAVCTLDHSVQFWDVTLTNRLKVFENASDVFFPKGNKVVVLMSHDRAYVLDFKTLEVEVTIHLQGEWVPIRPTFTKRIMTVVTTIDEGGSFLLWLYCLNTGNVLHGSPHSVDRKQVAWSKPGESIDVKPDVPTSDIQRRIRGFLSPDELSTIDHVMLPYDINREYRRGYSTHSRRDGDDLDCRDGWIWQGDEKLVLLPPEFITQIGYGRFKYTSRIDLCYPKTAVCGDKFVIVPRRGAPAFFKFNRHYIPTRK